MTRPSRELKKYPSKNPAPMLQSRFLVLILLKLAIRGLRSNNFFRNVGIVSCNTLLLFLLHSAFAAEIPTVSPGKEVRITAPKTGNTFLLYVPIDYTHQRSFPVIFCYHGYRGTATTWPFKQVTKGQGFIIIGMNYATDAYYHKLRFTTTGPEKIFFDEALGIISTRVNVDHDYIFMGGYSQGGYSTTVLGEQLLDRLAGNLVLGAGRCYVDMNPPPRELIRGHPFFYGVGELDDPQYPRAKRALQCYPECGADVT